MSTDKPDSTIEAAFDRFPEDVRLHLLSLRQMIFETAAKTKGCGEIDESLKWGQPSYATHRPKSGTPIRLGIPKSGSGHYALYVHCQTSLIEQIKQQYPEEFDFEGRRAILFSNDAPYSTESLHHVIAMALMYYKS